MRRFWLLLACLAWLPACSGPLPVSTATPAASLATAPAAASPTAVLAPTLAGPRPVTFDTPDGASAQGQLYGAGTAAVIFAPMGDCVGDWAALAEAAAARGLLALTLQWRACAPAGVDHALLPQFVDDLRGAVAYVRGQGAERIILVGASLGGVASARLLAATQAAGLVVLAAPAEVPSLNVVVAAADLDSAAPKLFLTAEADAVVPASATRALHDLAADPKAFHSYPGNAHGTHLFATESGEAARAQILDFILAAAVP